MDVVKIICFFLSGFALGISVCCFINSHRIYKRLGKEKKKPELKTFYEPQNWRKDNPHLPLKREEGETSEAFIERVQQKLRSGELTPNAARLSLGLVPIKREGDGIKDCTTCKHLEKSSKALPCCNCYAGHRLWEPKA